MIGWSTARLSRARYEIAPAVVGTKVLFAGGSDEGVDSDVVDMYDATSEFAALSNEAKGKHNRFGKYGTDVDERPVERFEPPVHQTGAQPVVDSVFETTMRKAPSASRPT